MAARLLPAILLCVAAGVRFVLIYQLVHIYRCPMTQMEINRAVALATGESAREIRRRGFSLATSFDKDIDPEPWDRPPSVVDWDALDRQRPGLFP